MTVHVPSNEVRPLPALAKTWRMTRRKFLWSGMGLLTLTGAATGGYSYYEASQRLAVTTYRVLSPRWTSGQRLTITVITDLHAGGPNMRVERIRQIVDKANELRSDIVVLLGDYFATHRFVDEPVPHSVWAAELKRLRAPLGVW